LQNLKALHLEVSYPIERKRSKLCLPSLTPFLPTSQEIS
jgi:hypothetical protein